MPAPTHVSCSEETPEHLPESPSSDRSVHPVVLSVMRIFAALNVVSFGVESALFLGHESPRHATSAVATMFLLCCGLLLYTYVPRFTGRSPSLPVLLALAFLTPAVGQALALMQGTAAFEKMALELALFLAVPLLIVAWQYSLRAVVLLSVTTGLFDIALALIAEIGHERGEVLVHLVVGRTAGLTIAGYVVSRLVGEQRAQHRSLARAHVQLTHFADNLERLTASRERNRVARELHDTLAHSLSGLSVQLEAARSIWGRDADKARTLVDRAQVTAREGLREVRRALQALRASPLEDLGLTLAIRHLAEGMHERTGCTVELDLPDPPLLLSDGAEQGIFRIVQEALDNVERHAGATHVKVVLAAHGQSWRLVVSDDGRGFDASSVQADRHGLRGIRERAELLGGIAAWETSPGHGTRLLLTVDPSKGRTAP